MLKDWHKKNLTLKALKKIKFSWKFQKAFVELKLVEVGIKFLFSFKALKSEQKRLLSSELFSRILLKLFYSFLEVLS